MFFGSTINPLGAGGNAIEGSGFGAGVTGTVGRTGGSIGGDVAGIGRRVPPLVGVTGTFIDPFFPAMGKALAGGVVDDEVVAGGNGFTVAAGRGLTESVEGVRLAGVVHPIDPTVRHKATVQLHIR